MPLFFLHLDFGHRVLPDDAEPCPAPWQPWERRMSIT